MGDRGPLPTYVLRSGRRIAPFGDAPGEVQVLNRPLRERQEEAFTLCGCAPPEEVDGIEGIDRFPCLLAADYLFATRTLVQDYLGLARARGASGRCGIAASVFVEGTESLQQLDEVEGHPGARAYDLWYLVEAPGDEEALRRLPVDLVDPKESVEEPRLPPQFVNEATPTRVSVTSRQALHVTHWALILRVNLGAFVATLKDLWERRPIYIAWRFVMDKIFGRFRRVRLSRKGVGCEIHPTAVVEGSWLGDGVKIGAGAIVQGSVIGNQAIVEEGAIVELTIVGHRTWIGRKSVLFMTVVYDDAFIGHRLTQACVLGHRSCTTGGGYFIDMNFNGPVRVLQDGKVVDAGTNYLGVCLGHDVTMGTGIWVGAGREIPSGTFLIRDPGDVLTRLPREAREGQVMVVRGGRLEPLE